MKMLAGCILGLALTPVFAESCPPLLDHKVRYLSEEKEVKLCEEFKGDVLLVVNTASKCGFTPQYEGLEKMHSQLKDKGFAVVGFPSNDFGGQEPGNEKQIQDFCRLTYSVQFPMFAKTSVRGAAADPLYQQLRAQSGDEPKWNFHKYLINRKGELVASFPSQVAPDDPALVQAVNDLL